MGDSTPVIVWLRRDLRLADNRALHRAATSGRPVIPVYILWAASRERRNPGAASRWWLHHSLAALREDLERLGVPLLLRKGRPRDELMRLAAETGARAILCNRHYEPRWRAEEREIRQAAEREGIAFERFDGSMLHDPDAITGKSGRPLKVFSAFWRACLARDAPPFPVPFPAALVRFGSPIEGDALEDWNLLPNGFDWSGGLRDSWSPGERGATERLEAFLDEAMELYATARDLPYREGTSRLSAHLHFGEISACRIWHAVRDRMDRAGGRLDSGGAGFLRELGWREFNMHLLGQFPDIHERPIRREFEHFPWLSDATALDAWRKGKTGYPIVDAGMRELWQTGWMHNRVRMIAASFLVKDLMIPWRKGEEWFWDTLVDADLANNAGNWQWVAGCGADAAPYFRIFNPVLQARKFDPDGEYIRKWVPEIARLPDSQIHAPWEASEAVRAAAGIRLGETYPAPVVRHDRARARALEAFKSLGQR